MSELIEVLAITLYCTLLVVLSLLGFYGVAIGELPPLFLLCQVGVIGFLTLAHK
jgi:hypothetical protein